MTTSNNNVEAVQGCLETHALRADQKAETAKQAAWCKPNIPWWIYGTAHKLSTVTEVTDAVKGFQVADVATFLM